MRIIYILTLIFALTEITSAQCYMDRHNTSWKDAWVSCDVSPSPNSERGEGHWILYDFGKHYPLSTTNVWNYNDPVALDRGLREVVIDGSSDGITWQEMGVFTFPQSEGSSFYEGVEGPDLTGNTVRFVLITAVNNYGGDCYGLSEIRFNIDQNVSNTEEEELFAINVNVSPNPSEDIFNVSFETITSDKIQYTVSDMLGRVIANDEMQSYGRATNFDLNASDWEAGTYILTIRQGDKTGETSLVKIR